MTTEGALKAWETRRRAGWVHPNSRDPVEVGRKPAKSVKAAKKAGGRARIVVAKKAGRKSVKVSAAEYTLRAKKAWRTRRRNAKKAASA